MTRSPPYGDAMSFFCGLDLGQVNDYSASVLVERYQAEPAAPVFVVENGFKVDRTPPPEPPSYLVRGIHRYPRGTPYPAIVEDMNGRLGVPTLRSSTILVIDGTGVGRPVVDMFRRSPARPVPIVPVIITAGTAAGFEAPYHHVPKRDLVGAVQVVLQRKTLKIADVPERATLLSELQNFSVKITAAANATYEAWREGQHDDLVLALSLALWYSIRRGG